MSSFTSWIAPGWVGNPYLDLLHAHLATQGVDVERVVRPLRHPAAKFLDRWMFSRTRNILHLHWLHSFILAPEIRHSHARVAVMTAALSATVCAARAAGVKIVWTAHNLYDHERRKFPYDHLCRYWVAHCADAVIAHSPAARSAVSDTFGIGCDKIAVIPHGNFIDEYPNEISSIDAREYLGIDEASFVFLYFGKIRGYKNLLKLLETYRSINFATKTQLVIAGKPSDSELASTLAERARGRPDISLDLRFIPDEELQYLMNAADAVVLPYRDILTSGAAVAAMSFGKPIVAPNIGTLRDILDHGGGFLYDPSTPDGLARAMSTAHDQRDQLGAMGRSNLERAKKWSWDRVGKQTCTLYRHLLSQ